MSTLPFHRLPFKIDSAFIALVFFSFAYWNKDNLIKFITHKYNIWLLILFFAISAYLCIYNGWSNINSLDFGNSRLLFYPIALGGVFSVCLASHLISTWKCKKLRSVLAFYGKNSLLIFGFQSLFIRLYYLILNNVQNLNMELYAYNPKIHQVGAFVVVSFIMCPLTVCIIEFLRKRNIRIL